MTRDFLTAEFRMPALEPLRGSLEQLFDLMDALGATDCDPQQPRPVRPIEGVFLL